MLRATTNVAGGNHLAADTGILTPQIRWPLPPENLKLSADDVHIFCAQLDLPKSRLSELAKTLSPDEIERALHFHFERDQNRFIAARGQLREILGRFLETDAKEIIFSYGERGKPHLADAVNGQFLHFNLSHSDSLSLIAICRDCELGVDIERIRPVEITEPLVTQFFSPEELRQWLSMPPGYRAEKFFDHWTHTEAFLKFNGEGIGDFPYPIFQCEGNCFFQRLQPVVGYAGAIVAENSDVKVLCWKWISAKDCDKSVLQF